MTTEQSGAELLARAFDRHEADALANARAGDSEAAIEVLRLCVSGLDAQTLSHPLATYLADRLHGVVCAVDAAEALRKIKSSSGSVRSSRDAGIADALLVTRPAVKRSNPFPDWELPLAALGALLTRRGRRPEQCKASMDEARQFLEGPSKGLDRAEAGRILKNYRPLLAVKNRDLLRLIGGLREKLPTYLQQTRRT